MAKGWNGQIYCFVTRPMLMRMSANLFDNEVICYSAVVFSTAVNVMGFSSNALFLPLFLKVGRSGSRQLLRMVRIVRLIMVY